MSENNSNDSLPADPQVTQYYDQIDEIDRQLFALINKRAAMSKDIAELLRHQAGDEPVRVFQPERDADVLRQATESANAADSLVGGDSIQRIYREILSACAAFEEPLQVAYLGPEGTYSHTAADRYFGHTVATMPQSSIAEIFLAVETGRAKFGVVPVENSTEGAVNQTLDLLTQTTLRVCGEVKMRIQHSLLSNAAALAGVAEVHAHPQALAQCAQWLTKHLPQAARISESSNAAAAKLAIERTDIAAIAGEAAAQLYGLTTLSKGIEDEKNNTTRFLVIGNEQIPPSGEDSSLLLISAPHRPGGLRSMLGPLEDAGVSMTRIESRPSRSALWEYVFFVNVDGHEHDGHLSKVLSELREFAPLVKVLGSYPRAL